jgi:hypothetical protein
VTWSPGGCRQQLIAGPLGASKEAGRGAPDLHGGDAELADDQEVRSHVWEGIGGGGDGGEEQRVAAGPEGLWGRGGMRTGEDCRWRRFRAFQVGRASFSSPQSRLLLAR